MKTCELNNPANQALIAAANTYPLAKPLESLQTSQHRKMLITAQKLIKTYDDIAGIKNSFFTEQVKANFGDDIEALRSCAANSLQLADYMTMRGGK